MPLDLMPLNNIKVRELVLRPLFQVLKCYNKHILEYISETVFMLLMISLYWLIKYALLILVNILSHRFLQDKLPL